MADEDTSWETLIENVSMARPHLVILGAGASRQAFPSGERNGRLIPLMGDLIELAGVRDLVVRAGMDPAGNFESTFSELASSGKHPDLVAEIEEVVHDYFSDLALPDEITLYDRLIHALRPKDTIATFNWDPFLWDAWVRSPRRDLAPHLVFLHGNVRVAFCADHRKKSQVGMRCSVCHKVLTPSRLLYPVEAKDYASDPFLLAEWGATQDALRNAWALTVFGYGAPRTEVEALRLFRDAWGDPAERNLEELEFIDLADGETLQNRWGEFIFSHHFRTTTDFGKSLLSGYPRRTCEALWETLLEVNFTTPAIGYNEIASLAELKSWMEPLWAREDR